jgi:AcrR family transcriptional regulator
MAKNIVREKRTMTVFIDAAAEIIKEEGINNITIRKVADKAGYNSATIYNYFEKLDHLVLFASMKYLKAYALALPVCLKDANSALDKFLKIWECFCYFSFKDPEIYYSIFFSNLDKNLEDYIIEYYKMFPEELGAQSNSISSMLLKYNIYERGMTLVSECVNEGFVKKDDAEALNEMSTLMYEGILLKVLKGKISSDKALEKTMSYIKLIADSLAITSI